MPRRARIDYPGALHHVIGRGIERRNIFKEDSFKAEFCRRMAEGLHQYDVECYAWCVMENHFHLLLKTGKTSLSKFMQGLLTGYAVYYNLRNKRSGHLFQNRYKAIICDQDEYLLPLVRYIHLNPVKANIVSFKDLEKYRWTGHREIYRKEVGLISNRDELLRFFGLNKNNSLKNYKQFLKDGLDQNEDFEGGGRSRSDQRMIGKSHEVLYDKRILGRRPFVESVLTRMGESKKTDCKTIHEVLDKVCKYYGFKEEEILETRARHAREARDIFVYLGRQLLGESMTGMAKMMGIKQSAVSMAYMRMHRHQRRNELEEAILK